MAYKDKNKRRQNDREKKRRYREERKALLVAYKGGICQDCKHVYPLCVYEFDHLKDKSFVVGTEMLLHTIEELKIEVDKCDLVCSNCHQIRTQERARSLK
jgi:hypothetical protein